MTDVKRGKSVFSKKSLSTKIYNNIYRDYIKCFFCSFHISFVAFGKEGNDGNYIFFQTDNCEVNSVNTILGGIPFCHVDSQIMIVFCSHKIVWFSIFLHSKFLNINFIHFSQMLKTFSRSVKKDIMQSTVSAAVRLSDISYFPKNINNSELLNMATKNSKSVAASALSQTSKSKKN